MMIKQFLWTLPFIIFLTSYFITSQFFHVSSIKTPALVGKTIQQAFKLLSHHNLHPHLLAEKEEPDLPDGTIVSQIPAPGSSIKIHQTVYCVISRKPDQLTTPLCVGKDLAAIKVLADEHNIRIKTHFVPSSTHPDLCIAQYPCAGHPLNKQALIIYLSKGVDTPIICPCFIGKLRAQAIEFLDFHQIPSTILASNPEITQDPLFQTVIDQRPLPGSLVNKGDPISLYVK